MYAYESGTYVAGADATYVYDSGDMYKGGKYASMSNDPHKVDRVYREHEAARLKVWATTVAGAVAGTASGNPFGVVLGAGAGAFAGTACSCTGVGCHVTK